MPNYYDGFPFDDEVEGTRLGEGDFLDVRGMKERYNDGYKTYFQETIDGHHQKSHWSGWIDSVNQESTGMGRKISNIGIATDVDEFGNVGDEWALYLEDIKRHTWPNHNQVRSYSTDQSSVVHRHPCMTILRPDGTGGGNTQEIMGAPYTQGAENYTSQRPVFYPAAFGNYHYTQTHYIVDGTKSDYASNGKPVSLIPIGNVGQQYDLSAGGLYGMHHQDGHRHFGPTNYYSGYTREDWGHGMWQNAFALNLARGAQCDQGRRSEGAGVRALVGVRNDFKAWVHGRAHDSIFDASGHIGRMNSEQHMGTNGHPAWRFVNGHQWFYRFQKGQEYVMLFNKANALSHYVFVLKEALESNLNGIKDALFKTNTSNKSGIILTGYGPPDGGSELGGRAPNFPTSEQTQRQGMPGDYNFIAQDWYANNIVDPNYENPNPGFGTLAYTGRMTNPSIYAHNPVVNYKQGWSS